MNRITAPTRPSLMRVSSVGELKHTLVGIIIVYLIVDFATDIAASETHLTWETLEGLVKHNGPLTDRAGQLAPRYREMFSKSAYLGREYKETLQQRVRRIRERYGLASGPIEYRPELWIEEQMDLWSSLDSTTTSPKS